MTPSLVYGAARLSLDRSRPQTVTRAARKARPSREPGSLARAGRARDETK